MLLKPEETFWQQLLNAVGDFSAIYKSWKAMMLYTAKKDGLLTSKRETIGGAPPSLTPVQPFKVPIIHILRRIIQRFHCKTLVGISDWIYDNWCEEAAFMRRVQLMSWNSYVIMYASM